MSNKPFGWEVDVEFHPASGKPMETFHYLGTEAKAKARPMMKVNAERIVATRPVSKEQWVRAYGLGRM